MGRFPRTSISSEKLTGPLRVVKLMRKEMIRKIIVTNGEHPLICKRGNFMSKNHAEIYYLIDNSSISGFSESHIEYMKNFYYSIYSNYSISKNKSPLCKEKLFTNMRRHKVKLVQICCPYYGNMNIRYRPAKFNIFNPSDNSILF